jgi:S1-C subfamily serine protease
MGVAIVGRLFTTNGLLAFGGTSTGFFITESGALATCRHVLELADRGLFVMTRDGRTFPVCQVLAGDPTNDVVILKVEGRGFTTLPIASNAPQGAAVWVLSHPERRLYTLTSGIVSGYIKWHGLRGDSLATWMTTTADLAEGSSGAPALDTSGAVIGVACRSEGYFADFAESGRGTTMVLRLCVPSSALLDLIKQE